MVSYSSDADTSRQRKRPATPSRDRQGAVSSAVADTLLPLCETFSRRVGSRLPASRRTFTRTVPLACCLALGLAVLLPDGVGAAPPAVQSATGTHAELRRLVGPGAKIITTRHFVVVYDTPIETVHRLTARVEATYRSIEKFCTFNKIDFVPPREPLAILLFDEPESFHRYAASIGVNAEGLSGFYYTGNNCSAFFNVLNHPNLSELRREIGHLERQVARFSGRQLSKTERNEKRAAAKRLHLIRNRRNRMVEKLNRSVVQHEVVHHLLFEAGVHPRGIPIPGWLVEGLAMLFESPPSSKGAGIGVVNQMRLADFRAACGEELDPQNKRPRKMEPETLRHAYDAGRFIPLRRFIPLSQLPNDANVGYYYAQAWGLTFYLQRTHRKELAGYINTLAHRRPGEQPTPEEELEQFEVIFGPVDERFERRWAALIFNLRFVPEFPGE